MSILRGVCRLLVGDYGTACLYKDVLGSHSCTLYKELRIEIGKGFHGEPIEKECAYLVLRCSCGFVESEWPSCDH